MKKPLKIFIGIFAVLIICYLCSYATYVKASKDYLKSQANSELYNLSNTLDALDYLDKHPTDDPIMREKLEISLVGNLIILNILKPKMSDLHGTPLSAVCKAIAYKRKHIIGANGLGKYKDKKLAQIALDYLRNVEPELSQYVKSIDSFPIDGCEMLKNQY